MKLGSLIPEVNILCVKSQDKSPATSDFFVEKWYFLFQYHFLKTFKCELWFPLNSKKFATLPF